MTAAVDVYHLTCGHLGYSVTCEEFDRLASRTPGLCELCGIPQEETPRGLLVLDHDHQYGNAAVRGLVCDQCNAHLRRVDAGERILDAATRAYFRRAWFIELNDHRRGLGPLRPPHITWKAWSEFGRVAGPQGRSIVVEFLRWYAGDRTARMPRRPRSLRSAAEQ